MTEASILPGIGTAIAAVLTMIIAGIATETGTPIEAGTGANRTRGGERRPSDRA